MPGMMETILNLGLNDRTVEGLAHASGNARFAYDSYRRFIQMYGDVVLGVPLHDFEHLLGAKRMTSGVENDAELAKRFRDISRGIQGARPTRTGSPSRWTRPMQLWGAIEAVWKSWTLKKAATTQVNGIAERWGLA